jgi:serine/threonine protein kinase
MTCQQCLLSSCLQYINYLSWKRRLQMLHDAAAGMLFLHSRRYVHGDLRSPNLFVTENGRVSALGHIACANQLFVSLLHELYCVQCWFLLVLCFLLMFSSTCVATADSCRMTKER